MVFVYATVRAAHDSRWTVKFLDALMQRTQMAPSGTSTASRPEQTTCLEFATLESSSTSEPIFSDPHAQTP